jgi:adenylate cyclase
MSMSRRDRRDWRTIMWVMVICLVASAGQSAINRPEDSKLLPSVLEGCLDSVLIALPILLLEIRGDRVAWVKRLQRQPLVVYFAFKLLFYFVAIVGGLLISRFVFAPDFAHFSHFDSFFRSSILFAFGLSAFLNLVFEVAALVGFRTLRSLLTGRYVQPKLEERVFLLIDMKDSTGMAERLGSIKFHELLNDFFRDVTAAALECEAEIHKYVGDEAILTWPAGEGLTDGGCLECPFIAADLIERNRAAYLARYGILPSFRAAAHYGEIVAGELGDVRREIAFIGDTLNVAARLLDSAKTLGCEVLVSEDLLQQAALPEGIKAERLPTLTVRGRAAPLGIAALRRTRRVSAAAS